MANKRTRLNLTLYLNYEYNQIFQYVTNALHCDSIEIKRIFGVCQEIRSIKSNTKLIFLNYAPELIAFNLTLNIAIIDIKNIKLKIKSLYL